MYKTESRLLNEERWERCHNGIPTEREARRILKCLQRSRSHKNGDYLIVWRFRQMNEQDHEDLRAQLRRESVPEEVENNEDFS